MISSSCCEEKLADIFRHMVYRSNGVGRRIPKIWERYGPAPWDGGVTNSLGTRPSPHGSYHDEFHSMSDGANIYGHKE